MKLFVICTETNRVKVRLRSQLRLGKLYTLFITFQILTWWYSMAGGESCLCEAARTGNLEQVRQLLQTGQDVNQLDQHGETPLIIASCLGYTKVTRLVAVWPQVLSPTLQIVSALLVSEEISVNMKTPEGWTALVAAADKGHHDLVKTLLKNKAVDVNVRDNQSEFRDPRIALFCLPIYRTLRKSLSIDYFRNAKIK